MWRKGNPLALLVGMWTATATLENCVGVPQRVKNRATLWPSNCTTGNLPQRYKCSEKLRHLHPNVYSSNVHNSQTVEGASLSIERWMDKEDVVYIYNGILLNHQKGWIPTICLDMDETGGYHAEWSKWIGKGQSLYGSTHTGNIRNSARDYRGKEGKWVGKIREGGKKWETPNSGKRTRGSGRGGGQGGWGDWVTGTEGGTWRDEHWVLFYMLANRTPIKNIQKNKFQLVNTQCNVSFRCRI